MSPIEESHVLIALDEIDNIGENDNILYKLPRCNNEKSAAHIPSDVTKVGGIGNTNDGNFKDYLDPRAKSTLCTREVHFPPYDAVELQTIFQDSATVAFHDGVLEDDVIRLTAALAVKRKRYARTALDLLYEAADMARKGGDAITAKDVRRAEKYIQQVAIVKEVEGLSSQGKLIAYTLLTLHEEEESPAKLDKLYAWYETYATTLEMDTVTARTVHNILNDLMMNGVATSHEVNKGRRGGRHYEYDRGTQPKLVIDGLREETRFGELPNEDRF